MANTSCAYSLVNGQWIQSNACADPKGCPPVPVTTINAIKSRIQAHSDPAFEFRTNDELIFDCYVLPSNGDHYATKVFYRPGGSVAGQLAFTIQKQSAEQAPTVGDSAGSPLPLGPSLQ